MDNRSRSENKYFFLSIKKEQTELCVFFVPTLSEALRKYGRDSLLFYFFNRHAVHRVSRPLTKSLWSGSHSHVGRWIEDDNG